VIPTFRGQSVANFVFSGAERFAKRLIFVSGWVAEWFKAPVLKTGVGSRSPGVRIPPHPPAGNFSRAPGGT
jgi:hypothetical protein